MNENEQPQRHRRRATSPHITGSGGKGGGVEKRGGQEKEEREKKREKKGEQGNMSEKADHRRHTT